MLERGTRAFVGREGELEELTVSLDAGLMGTGTLWLLCGEPGIGKSRLAECVTTSASAQGYLTLSGACWEAGGAPPFWPWIQALRGLVRQLDDAARQRLLRGREAVVAQLLPELAERLPELPTQPPLEPEQARFRLLDAVSSLLCDAAHERPLLVLLEDLHAADPATVALLEFVAPLVGTAPLIVIGTMRDAEAEALPIGPQLARVLARSRSITLTRLAAAAVGEYLAAATGEAPSPEVVDAMLETTEGSPLFVVELTRLLLARGDLATLATEGAKPIPSTVRHAISQRLARLTPRSLALLEKAAVIGREVETSSFTTADAAELARAVEASLLVAPRPGVLRFAHALVREVIYQRLDPERREMLHLQVADELAATASPAELAHHLVESGPPARSRAINALVAAARYAEEQLAFDDAVRDLERALALAEASRAAAAERAELGIALGRARLASGRRAAGQAACREALRLAREAGLPELVARAVLEHGSALVYVVVDRELVVLLREALEALGPGDGALKARVLARLAAAEQPAPDPSGPMNRAREAIAMARRLGDPGTLLDTIRTGCSALMDIAPPGERRTLNRELVALAQSQSDRLAELQGQMRLVFDCFELGDVTAAAAAIEAARRIGDDLAFASYRWRGLGLAAMHATWQGRFAEADQLAQEAQRLGEQAQDPNARRALAIQRIGRLRLQGRWEEALAQLPQVVSLLSGSPVGEQLARVVVLAERTRAGRRPSLSSDDERALAAMLRFGDRTVVAALAVVAHGAERKDLAHALYDRLVPYRDHLVAGGMSFMTWEGPVTYALGLAASTLGRDDEALAHFEAARERMLALGSRPHACWIALHVAELTSGTRRRELLDEAAATADELGMPGLAEGAASRRETRAAPTVPRATTALALTRSGDYWDIVCGQEHARLRDSRGLQMLDRLVRAAGRELHALELSNPESAGEVDRGDAGEAFDGRAREEYRRRVVELKEELDEAEAWNDAGRVEKARAELDAITRELSRGVGIGGRERRLGNAAERARSNVQRRLKDAIRRIATECPELGRHLEWAVTTGTFCSYRLE